jgi:hypothetical protein
MISSQRSSSLLVCGYEGDLARGWRLGPIPFVTMLVRESRDVISNQ